MYSSIVSSNPSVNSDRSSSARKKRKKKTEEEAQNLISISTIQWKSEAQQRIYSSKLLHALQRVRLSNEVASKGRTPRTSRVRDAANRVLAIAAKGRTRWSREILTSRFKLKLMNQNTRVKRQRKVMTLISTGKSLWQKKSKVSVVPLKPKGLPAFQRKARLLSRLIPGCEKQPVHVVLEEALDYIPALEMQVGAMSALVEMLSGSGSSTSDV